MSSRDSISFDQAADFYDKTRALSRDATARVVGVLERELAGRNLVLEVGVGTGRIALPLAGRGFSMTGLDLSANMLAKLAENAGGSAPFPLVRGDATVLPFKDGSFDAAIASWVLHLIPGWRDVLAEMVRVASGGILLVNMGSQSESILTRLTWRFRDVARVTDWPRGAENYAEVDEVMAELGARRRSLDPVLETTETTLEEHIALLERGIFSVSWGIDQDTRSRAAGELREWAVREYGALTETRAVETQHAWRAYDLTTA